MSKFRRLVAVAESNKQPMRCALHPERVATHRYAAWDRCSGMCEDCAEQGKLMGYGASITRIERKGAE